MQAIHLLSVWHLTASFFLAAPHVPERFRAVGSKAPRGQKEQRNLKIK